MKTYKEFISELFDSGYGYWWTEKSDDGWIAQTQTQNGKLVIYFDDLGEDDVEIHFEVGGTARRTGAGNAQAIFTTVLDATKEYVKANNPNRIILRSEKEGKTIRSTNPDSRAKLYTALSKRFAGKLGYKIQRIHNSSSGQTIHLERK